MTIQKTGKDLGSIQGTPGNDFKMGGTWPQSWPMVKDMGPAVGVYLWPWLKTGGLAAAKLYGWRYWHGGWICIHPVFPPASNKRRLSLVPTWWLAVHPVLFGCPPILLVGCFMFFHDVPWFRHYCWCHSHVPKFTMSAIVPPICVYIYILIWYIYIHRERDHEHRYGKIKKNCVQMILGKHMGFTWFY